MKKLVLVLTGILFVGLNGVANGMTKSDPKKDWEKIEIPSEARLYIGTEGTGRMFILDAAALPVDKQDKIPASKIKEALEKKYTMAPKEFDLVVNDKVVSKGAISKNEFFSGSVEPGQRIGRTKTVVIRFKDKTYEFNKNELFKTLNGFLNKIKGGNELTPEEIASFEKELKEFVQKTASKGHGARSIFKQDDMNIECNTIRIFLEWINNSFSRDVKKSRQAMTAQKIKEFFGIAQSSIDTMDRYKKEVKDSFRQNKQQRIVAQLFQDLYRYLRNGYDYIRA